MQSIQFPKRPLIPRSVLIARAIDLRVRQKPSEAALWEAVRAKKLGFEVRRQVPIGGKFIADVYVPECRLIIEVDGTSHKAKRRADARRDEVLRRLGYRVLRLRAELVERNLAEAVAHIHAELKGSSP